MKKYKVYGTVTVNVIKEVWANSEGEALDKAYEQLPLLTVYCGNGSDDRLIGVEEEGESVEVYDDIEYDEAKEIEDDPDYFECPECGEPCERRIDNDGDEYWYCNDCYHTFDDDGDEFYPNDDDEDEEE